MQKNQISEAEELWLLCFDDTPDTPRALSRIDDIETLTIHEGDTLSAMATLVPVRTDAGDIGFYAYGVCTRPECRGRGLFRKIMALSEERSRERGADFICLIAADERLRDTYTRMGYTETVTLTDLSPENKRCIICESEGFREFSKPDTNETACYGFGLLKPLSTLDTSLGFHFSSHMGEI